MRAEQPLSGRFGETGRHSIFVIGRIRNGEQKLIFLRPQERPFFPGPWEVRAVLAGDAIEPNQLDVRLVNERVGVEGMVGALSAQMPPRDLPQLVVEHGHQPIGGSLASTVQLRQQPCHLALPVHRFCYFPSASNGVSDPESRCVVRSAKTRLIFFTGSSGLTALTGTSPG